MADGEVAEGLGNACLDGAFTAYLRNGSLPAGKGPFAKACSPEPDPQPVSVPSIER